MNPKVVVFIVAILTSCFAPSSAQVQEPLNGAGVRERIILMRHAEKPDDDDDPNLTAAGNRRAQLLTRFIVEHYGKPDYIFAAANSKKSMRPVETALPLSNATGVPINTSFKNDDFPALASMLLSDSRFFGKTILVVWHHGNIPDFASCLHAKDGTYPSKWSGHNFNQFLEFDYVGKHHPVVALQTEPF